MKDDGLIVCAIIKPLKIHLAKCCLFSPLGKIPILTNIFQVETTNWYIDVLDMATSAFKLQDFILELDFASLGPQLLELDTDVGDVIMIIYMRLAHTSYVGFVDMIRLMNCIQKTRSL